MARACKWSKGVTLAEREASGLINIYKKTVHDGSISEKKLEYRGNSAFLSIKGTYNINKERCVFSD